MWSFRFSCSWEDNFLGKICCSCCWKEGFSILLRVSRRIFISQRLFYSISLCLPVEQMTDFPYLNGVINFDEGSIVWTFVVDGRIDKKLLSSIQRHAVEEETQVAPQAPQAPQQQAPILPENEVFRKAGASTEGGEQLSSALATFFNKLSAKVESLPSMEISRCGRWINSIKLRPHILDCWSKADL